MTEPSASAKPALTLPYPVPQVYTATIRRPDGRIGISFIKSNVGSDPVCIKEMSDTCPLNGSGIAVGQVVVSINGVTPHSPKHAVALINDAASSITFITCDEIKSNLYKMIVAPSWKHHPGLSFRSTRGRCLVQVSRLFAQGPFAGSKLNQDDIILAVNGYPVSKPEEADAALRISREQPVTTIYALDISLLRNSIMDSLWLEYRVKLHESKGLFSISHNNKGLCKVAFDYETQHMKIHPSEDLPSGQYRSCFKKFNELIGSLMRPIEEDALCEAWEHPIPSLHDTGSKSVPHPPVAQAFVSDSDVEVYPFAVLQRMSERDTVLSYS